MSKSTKKQKGIECPRCGCRDFRDDLGRPWEISHTRPMSGWIRRYRTCRHCGKRIRTREKIDK